LLLPTANVSMSVCIIFDHTQSRQVRQRIAQDKVREFKINKT
jgi:hypothetical protein